MRDIKVSIICNTYNHEQYISCALDSFLNQKASFDFEILVHDDASTDNTTSIVLDYSSRFPDIIKPIIQQENKLSQHINITATYQYPRAQGEYIAYCEGDDYWTDSRKLEKQILFLDQNPQFIGCVTKYKVVDENNKVTPIRTFGYYEDEGVYTLEDYLSGELPSQMGSLVCRNIFMQNIEKLKEIYKADIQGDIKLYLFLLAFGDIFRMKEEMSAYRFVVKEGGTSWSSRQLNTKNNFRNWAAICSLEKTYYQLFDKKISMDYRRKKYAYDSLIDLNRTPNIVNLRNAIEVLLKEKHLFSYAVKRKMKEKWRKNE